MANLLFKLHRIRPQDSGRSYFSYLRKQITLCLISIPEDVINLILAPFCLAVSWGVPFLLWDLQRLCKRVEGEIEDEPEPPGPTDEDYDEISNNYFTGGRITISFVDGQYQAKWLDHPVIGIGKSPADSIYELHENLAQHIFSQRMSLSKSDE